MRRLFALIGFPYLLTLAAAVYFGGTVSLFLAMGCCAAAMGAVFLRRRFDIRLPVLILLTAAFALSAFSSAEQRREAATADFDQQKVTVTGRLCDLPYEQYNKHYYILEVSSVTRPDGTPAEDPLPQKIRISTQNPLKLDLYEELTGTMQLYLPKGNDGFSSRSYYASKGVEMFGFLYEYEPYSIERDVSKPPYLFALRIREAMLRSVAELLPKQEASLLSAAILGEKQDLDVSVREDFIRSGIYHVLVVSGLHMSLITLLLLKIFQKVKIPRRIAVLLTMAGAVCFMAITGFSPGVTRSGIMMLIMLAGMLLHQKADAVNSLGVAVFCICILNPFAAADTGLLLSCMSTLGILVLAPKLKKQVFTQIQTRKRNIHLPGLFRRLLRYCLDILCVTCSVMIFTMPIQVLSGREISLIAPLTNLLLLPLATVMIETGLLSSLLCLVPGFGFLSMPLGLIAGWMGKLLLWSASLFSKIPFASVPSSYGYVTFWLMLALLLFAYILLFAHRKAGYAVGAVLVCLILFTGIFSYQLVQRDRLRLAVLDVGDGLSVVLSKNGSAAVIGCEGLNPNTLIRHLRQENIRRIDYMQMTSGEKREMENASEILKAFPTKHVLLEKRLYVSGSLEKTLAKSEEVSYYQSKAEATVLDNVEISMDSSFAYGGVLVRTDDLTFLIVSDSYRPRIRSREKNSADILIADGLPEDTLGGAYLTTILSMSGDEDLILEGKAYLEEETVNVYTTGGKGNLLLDLNGGRSVTIRRGE